jgi:molybdenum cofactor cytidylyltransferase
LRLAESLALGGHEIIAIVGGGGKTTALYRLAREAAEDGGRAVVCGTTLFTPPPDRISHPIVLADDPETLVEATSRILRGDAVVVATTGHGSKGRLLAVPPDLPSAFAAIQAVTRVVVEAEGSRGRAFKAPAEHEPVIPGGVTIVIAVAGMSALGAPLDDEHVHRPERVAALTRSAEGTPVTEEMIALVLAHRAGGRKSVPSAGCRFAVMLNQVDGENIDAARRIGKLLITAGVERVVLAHAREDPPAVEVITSK